MPRHRLIFPVVLALAASFASVAFSDVSDPAAQSALLPSPAESGMPEKITRKEVRRIRREFTDVLDQERDSLRAELSRLRREGDAARKFRKKNWDNEEKLARRKFFAVTHRGAEKREYMSRFNQRRKAFYEQLKDEELRERADQDARWKALRESQRLRLVTVEEYLRRSERPLGGLLERQNG